MKNKSNKNKNNKNSTNKNKKPSGGGNNQNTTNLKIEHAAGFFSTCSVYLHNIIDYVNKNHKLPRKINTDRLFEWYKPEGKKESIVSEYFKTISDPINYTGPINYNHELQYTDYNKLDYKSINPYIKRYFTPTDNITENLHNMEKKYNLDYSNTCVLFFRGNDKNTETPRVSFDKYFEKVSEIQAQNPGIKFLIQSDETDFIEAMSKIPNSFSFKEEIRHIKRQRTTVNAVNMKSNNEFSKKFLAVTLAMSKCKYIVCTTGNCSIWICLFRGNADGVHQLKA